MNNKRRDFVKLSSPAGAGVISGMILGTGQANGMNPFPYIQDPEFNMHGYAVHQHGEEGLT